MLGLNKCKEEDFYEFRQSNWKYKPDDFDGYLLAMLVYIFIMLLTEYFYWTGNNMSNQLLFKRAVCVFVLFSIFIYKLNRIKNHKYAYKFQKSMIIVLGIYWLITSFIAYPAPLILGIAEHHDSVVQAVIGAVIIGLVYFICIFIRLIYLIKKGEMGEQCEGLYERLINSKLAAGAGVSIPFVVASGKLARNITKVMDSTGNGGKVLVLMIVIGFIINIIMITYVPEFIVLAYCKFRFKSFDISGDPKVRERMHKQEERRKRRERNNMQMKKKSNKKS